MNNPLIFVFTHIFVTVFCYFEVNPTVGINVVKANVSGEWPRRESKIYIDGDIILGGLMMVHERDGKKFCGPIMPQGGIQALEAMLYTLDKINADPSLLPGFKLGTLIKDDCDSDTYGLKQSVDFIRGSIDKIGGEQYYTCPRTGEKPRSSMKSIAGVVGAGSSTTSIQLASILKLFRIPQVSFFSTSPQLSNKERFPYFARTIPSDDNQAEAMVDLVKVFNWTSVSVVYEESSYGLQGFIEVERLLKANNICIAATEKLIKDSGVESDLYYDKIVTILSKNPNVRGVIVFGSDQEVGTLMRGVRKARLGGHFIWIGSDGWGGRSIVTYGNEKEVEGALTIQPLAEPVSGFREYFSSLTPETNRRNPWFTEYWEQHFQCRYPMSSYSPWVNPNWSPCESNLAIGDFDMEAQLQYVSDAVLSFAVALDDIRRQYCPKALRPSDCPQLMEIDGDGLYQRLLESSFTGLSGERFSFKPNGDGPAKYRILNFRQTDAKGLYEWRAVGSFKQQRLTLDMEGIQYTAEQPDFPLSACGRPCVFGQAQKFVDGDKCCWTCITCTEYDILSEDESDCKVCPLGFLPNAAITACIPIPEDYLKPTDFMGALAMAFSGTGMAITIFVLVMFVRHRNTAVVKAASTELSYILLIGILGCYSSTFLIVLWKPTDLICICNQLWLGLWFAVIYAALLTKTNRIQRIFHAGKRTKKVPMLISPGSQVVITGGISTVQLFICIVWVIISPSNAIHHYPTRESNLVLCSAALGPSYLVAFSYPMLLVFVCTIYAFLTRNIPGAFNESKHIAFTVYTTCVIWLAFIAVYIASEKHVSVRQGSTCFTISLSATVALCCLFAPRVYIILFRPELNVRKPMGTPSNGMGTQNLAPGTVPQASSSFLPVHNLVTLTQKSTQTVVSGALVCQLRPFNGSVGSLTQSINSNTGKTSELDFYKRIEDEPDSWSDDVPL